jgi:DNA-binding CsgD family transcriptional regulator
MRTELVGRELELAALTRCLAAAVEGRPQLVWCQGEAGIGKTRLSDELVALAAAKGALGVWGLAADSSSAPPYWPWWQVFRAVANTVDLATISRERRLDADLARLAPDVFSSPEAQRESASAADDRFRQFDAVARLLRQVCLQTPLVIVLDDVHWADKPTLLLLQHVARGLTDERLLLLVNARVAEQRHGDLLTRLLREPLTTQIHLRGLAAPAIRQQLTSVVGHEVADRNVAEVQSLTGGNPFFVGEVGRAMAAAGAGGRSAPVTRTVRDAIGDRLGQLSQECVRFVQAAAIVGREFAVPVVSTMVELPAVSGLNLVDEAERAGLVEAGSAPHEYRFVHALVGDAIEAGLASPQQVHLHRLAADALERHYAHRLGPHLFDVARHWAEAAVEGDTGRAAAWIRRAGEEAMRQLAYEEGARLFRQALHIGGADLSDDERCSLLLAAGRALHLSADLGGRLDACLEAAEVARTMSRPDLVAEAALVMEAAGHPGFDIATRRLCEEALAALDPEPTALRARLTARFVETFIFLRDLEDVAPASEQALDMATRCGDRLALIAALRARQLVCSGPDGLEERMRLAERMLALSREAADPQAEMWARLWQIDASLERGDLARVGTEIDALALCAQQVRGPLARFEVLRCRAVLAQAQGRFADARLLERDAFTVLAPPDHDLRFTFRSALSTSVGHHLGHDAASLAAAGCAGAPEEHAQMLGLIGRVAGAHALVSAGKLDTAGAMYRSAGPVSGWQPPPHVVLCAYTSGLVAAVALGESADVAVLHDLLEPYRGHHVASGTTAMVYLGPVELRLGIAAHHLGRLDDAVRELEQAEQACARNGAAGFRVEAQYELAAVLARRAAPGDAERARSLLTTAGRAAGSLGMAPFAAKISELTRQLAEAAEPIPLTRRERDVAELVAQGLTNREIAERLFLSERTAENHVQHILAKLNVSNRSQVAVWVTSRK